MIEYLFSELNTREKANVCCKLVFKDYSLVNDCVLIPFRGGMVVIRSCDNRELKDWIHNFAVGLEDIYIPLDNFFQKLKMESCVECLRFYKNSLDSYILGSELDVNYLCKLYHFEAPNNIEQNGSGRTWIDYPAQLRLHEDYIQHETPMWSSKLQLSEMLTEFLIDRYGDSIMLLRPIKDEYYIELDKEVVGRRFYVLVAGKLSDESTWNALMDYLTEEEYSSAYDQYSQLESVKEKE